MTSERERVHAELLDSLQIARERVAKLEADLAHNAALLGIGIEREDQLGEPPPLTSRAMSYLELVEKKNDLSTYIGTEGNDRTRPRLGPDAPAVVRPNKAPQVSQQTHQVALVHPDDSISFTLQTTEQGTPAAVDTSAAASHSTVVGASKSDVPPHTDATLTTDSASESTLSVVSRTAKPNPLTVRTKAVVEENVEVSRAFLALQAINEGVWDWNVETGQEYQSPRWRAILGVAPVQGATPLDTMASLLHPVDATMLRSKMTALMDGKLTRLRVAVRIHQPDGIWTWGLLRAVCRKSQGGKHKRIVATLADITSQREAELALPISEEKFRALAEDSPDFIARFDSNCCFLYASPNARRYLPMSPEQIIGQPFSAYYSGADSQFFEENLRRTFEMGLPVQVEAHLVSPLVGEFVAECHFWPEFDGDGAVISVTAQVRDRTYSRRLAENYHALFNSMADGFALFEKINGRANAKRPGEIEDFVLIAANPALGKMLHLDVVKATGRRLSELMGDDAPLWGACLSKVLQNNRPSLHSLRGSALPALLEVSAYTPEPGRVACIVKDVTEMHVIEQEVRLNEARFAALYLLSHMDDAPEEEVVQFSLDQAVHLTGSEIGYLSIVHRREGEKGKVYWSREIMAHYEGQDTMETLRSSIEPELGLATPLRIRKARIVNAPPKGPLSFGPQLVVRSYMLAPVIEEGRVVCIAAVANKRENYESSDLRQLELFINGMWFQLRRRWALQTLQKAKEEAEAASTAKNEFLANVSHELRTPLNGMLGMLQLLQQSTLTAEQMECVTTANYSGRSLLRIISDILDFSRIEAGRFELKPQLFDFAATVRSTLGMFLHQAEEKKLGFTLQLHDSIPPLLLGDDARIRQIIFNLVGNAFKFTTQGSVTVECSLLPLRHGGKYRVYFAVHDTGIGIPEEKFDVIFQAFTQLDGSSTRRYAGTGLGLGIVQRLVRLMGGSLCVDSELGSGTTIHCSLPFAAAAKRGPARARPELESYPLQILVAEDDPINQRTIERLLEKYGHTVVCVNDGRQALEALMLSHFDCLITDIQMPEMDGVEVVGRIRRSEIADIEPSAFVLGKLGVTEGQAPVLHAIAPELPVIALTAHAMTGDKERFLALGMDYYLAKPIIAAELALVLHQVAVVLRNSSRA